VPVAATDSEATSAGVLRLMQASLSATRRRATEPGGSNNRVLGVPQRGRDTVPTTAAQHASAARVAVQPLPAGATAYAAAYRRHNLLYAALAPLSAELLTIRE
jgi:hypothetical protein